MSGMFPGAGDTLTFWKNIAHKIDAIRPVPENRIDALYFDPGTTSIDRFYSCHGGFIDEFAEFDPVKFGILPVAVEGTEPDHLLTLHLAHKALADAGMLESKQLDNTGIIIGKGNYAGPGAIRAIEIMRTGEQIVQLLKAIFPGIKREEADRIKKEFQLKKGRFGADTAMGLIPNLAASLVANRLNLGGAAYTIDAACASSLIAIDHAVKELRTFSADMVIAGGIHVGQNAAFWSIFTQLGALSRNQQIRPFDRKADGLLIGEGCGFVVLKRLEDAVRDDNAIYAVIKGIGVSSDGAGTSLMSPSVKGQSNAILRAWQQAQVPLSEVGYIEAHGTGTPLGDKTELETLIAVFGTEPKLPKAGIGTVKSMIGHAMPAAGIAGILKTALALHYDKLPPTLHCEEPLELMSKSRFEPVKELTEWSRTGLPQRAGVSAFGFGGINAHVVLEAFYPPVRLPGKGVRLTEVSFEKKEEVLLLARNSREALIKALEERDTTIGQGNYRIALFDPTPERIKKALKIAGRNVPWRNKQDIWFTNDPLITSGGKVAFMFPGLDGLAGGETESICNYFKFPPSEPNQEGTGDLLKAALKVVNRSNILDSALKQSGVQPDLTIGHSLGEWLAGRSAGMVTEQSVRQLLEQLNPASFASEKVQFMALGCGFDKLQSLLNPETEIYLSNDNCTQQVIVCGYRESLNSFSAILREKQIFHQVLPFRSGFHTPFVKDKLDLLLNGMELMDFKKPEVALWSATTLEPYPEDPAAIRKLSIDHLLNPVRFRELTEKLFRQGVKMFIQVGSGNLTGYINDTLRDKPYSVVASSIPGRSGIGQLKRVLAALFAEGKEADLSLMELARPQRSGVNFKKLELGSPLVSSLPVLEELSLSIPTVAASPVPENTVPSFIRTFKESCDEITSVQKELIELYSRKRSIQPVIKHLDISLENNPFLVDHSLVRQPLNWPCIADMEPVIPMTMTLELLAEAALENAPGKAVQKIRNVQTFQWMKVAKPFRETIMGTWIDDTCLSLKIDNYATAEVCLSESYNYFQGSYPAIGKLLDIPINAGQVYERNMFHGPAYQGIKQLIAFGEDGITGIIEGSTGKGSLLDNAGQLFGLWLQFALPKDQIAFPVKIQEIEFYGDMKDQRGSFECSCRLNKLSDDFASADFVLKRNGQVWAAVRGWQNKRLEIDKRLWEVCMSPLHHLLSEEIKPGIFLFYNSYQRAVSWDFILKRYFNQAEKNFYNSLLPRKKKQWLISRVAVKDAVRSLLLQTRHKAWYPIEFEIRSDAAGKPFSEGEMTRDIHISLSHKDTIAVATAREGAPVGIDMEEIRDRNPGFAASFLNPSELAMIETKNRDEWLTRCWVAKEAYGKYLGRGLHGDPKAYVIAAITGDILHIGQVNIKTIKHYNYIIGWTQ